jgi:hypothetical protein
VTPSDPNPSPTPDPRYRLSPEEKEHVLAEAARLIETEARFKAEQLRAARLARTAAGRPSPGSDPAAPQ